MRHQNIELCVEGQHPAAQRPWIGVYSAILRRFITVDDTVRVREGGDDSGRSWPSFIGRVVDVQVIIDQSALRLSTATVRPRLRLSPICSKSRLPRQLLEEARAETGGLGDPSAVAGYTSIGCIFYRQQQLLCLPTVDGCNAGALLCAPSEH